MEPLGIYAICFGVMLALSIGVNHTPEELREYMGE